MDNNRKFLLIAVALVILCIPVLWAIDPVNSEWSVWLPKCMIKELTGLQCPGCGITRAAHAALHGHFTEAYHYNLFFIVSIPYLIAIGMVSYVPALYNNHKLRRIVLGLPLAVTYVVLFVIWFVVRNILGI